LIERLESEEFFPSPSLQYAFETLSIGPDRLRGMALDPSAGDYFVMAEAMLSEEIETFAREFFAIQPAVRAERWRTLAEQAADFPALASRMRRLRVGLEAAAPPADAEPALKSLAEHVLELFTLPPHERARRRQFPSERFQPYVGRWPAAAARLRREFPKLAALEPQWIDRLTRPTHVATRGEALPSGRPAYRRPARVSETALHEFDPQEAPRSRRRGFSINLGGAGGWGTTIFAVMILRMILNLIGGCGSTSTPVTYPSPGTTYSTTNGYYNSSAPRSEGPQRTLTPAEQESIRKLIDRLQRERSEKRDASESRNPVFVFPPDSPSSTSPGFSR
jgi:hypothetical protein